LDRRSITLEEPVLPAAQRTAVSVERVFYHGWPGCYLISNGSVEATIVPAIGRIMQLRLAGEPDGAFWENRALDGQLHDAASNEWMNFGGDKCWPAPQAAWSGYQGRDWPPPPAFDARPHEAVAGARGVVLTSPIDPGLGIQVVRRVELDEGQPVMRIETEYRKLAGGPVRVGVWTITQLGHPERVCVLLPAESKFEAGYLRLLAAKPAELQIDGRYLSLRRHPGQCVKVGTDGSSLAWVGPNSVLRIDAQAGPGEYPDGGCVTEVYTNPNPLEYVELETLGPMSTMNVGNRIAQTTEYTLLPRSTPDPETEARGALR
jgi:hypothetical protein